MRENKQYPGVLLLAVLLSWVLVYIVARMFW